MCGCKDRPGKENILRYSKRKKKTVGVTTFKKMPAGGQL